MRRKRNYKLLLYLAILLVITLFGARTYYYSQLSPVNKNDTKVRLFVVPPGEATSEIAERLEKEHLIKSAFFFKLMTQSTGSGSKIQAGDFKISPAMSSEEILHQLSTGVIDKWVVLIEGWRIEEVAERLNRELGMDPNDFLKVAKEGYMFPDSYLVNPEITASDMAQLLETTFEQRYTDELKSKIKSNGLTPEQGVILASIVEREARSDAVRTEVASILLNRIKIGMKLDADATVQYALGYSTEEKGWWRKNLTREQINTTKSKYNTYLIPGLPPTPICNPSLSSLNAVANAHDTNYLYYYHDSKGNSYYAETLEQHNENVANHP